MKIRTDSIYITLFNTLATRNDRIIFLKKKNAYKKKKATPL